MIQQWISDAGRGAKDMPFVKYGKEEMIFGELTDRCYTIKKELKNYTAPVIALLLPNGFDYLTAFLGSLLSGKIVFPLHIAYMEDELLLLIVKAEVRCVITLRAMQKTVDSLRERMDGFLDVLYVDELSSITCNETPTESEINLDRPAVYYCTSGSTGNPRIVMLSHNNILACAEAYIQSVLPDAKEAKASRFLLCLPFSTAYATMLFLACIKNRIPFVIFKGQFSLAELYRTIAEEKITHFDGPASILTLMENARHRATGYSLESLRFWGFGGSKTAMTTILALSEHYKHIEFSQGVMV